jgi:Legionella pneumophila major outer membrane protein precursor
MKLKTITLAIAALGVSSVANAAMYAPECVGENVTVPCEQRGWHVGAQYIYVQPTGDQLYTDLNSQSRWASGFRVEGGYHFGTGNDITLNWIYFSKTSRRNVTPFNNPLLLADNDNLNAILGNAFGSGPFPSAESVKSQFNAVNLEFGQLAHWGERVSTRFHAGLQYVSIKRDRSHYNSSAVGAFDIVIGDIQIGRVDLANSGGISFEQKFSGIGPRLGLDTYYTFGESNFSLVGKGAVAVLAADTRVRNGIGQTNLLVDFTPTGGAATRLLNLTNNVTIPNARTRTLTVGLEAKLGVEYAYPLASGDLIFEGGYQWAAYPQSMLAPTAASVTPTIDLPILPVGPVTLAPIDLGLGVPGDLNNFGYHGFYVGLRWEGDLA